MTPAERLVLLLVADLALLADGYATLSLVQATRARLREARAQLDAEAGLPTDLSVGDPFRELTREGQ